MKKKKMCPKQDYFTTSSQRDEKGYGVCAAVVFYYCTLLRTVALADRERLPELHVGKTEEVQSSVQNFTVGRHRSTVH